ncbi:hypothetical protein DFH08DRAFT_828047 [Mycena albidolilacea]|uniref:Uncharacterized protein n=1 Tax=Mycena albidolilacea TaxID=1033008 RepID=A0AAD7E6Q4_9AGAR|nr:hypothetical protein DFH08DRAFT_828047 [Mycena albidolilacea]
MPAVAEASTSLSILASGLPADWTPWVAASISLIGGAGCIHYASPQHLTRVLLDQMARLKRNHLAGIENRALSACDVRTAGALATLGSLQLKVSDIRQVSLHSSLSNYAMFCDILNGRTFTILHCIHEICALKTHIELIMVTEQILKESHVRKIISRRLATDTVHSSESVAGF